ncbi:hypothetical protein PI125_g19404 [Phytophthora idaei]|nr:hypothetical protein PI125_g19404 [Phytophthora idaei]
MNHFSLQPASSLRGLVSAETQRLVHRHPLIVLLSLKQLTVQFASDAPTSITESSIRPAQT